MSGSRFSAGDRIEVRWIEGQFTGPDFGVVRGTALQSRGHTGYADFTVDVAGTEMHFNLNYVEVKVLEGYKIPTRNRNDLTLAKECIDQALMSSNQKTYLESIEAAEVWLRGARTL